jgi:hypothetical protein
MRFGLRNRENSIFVVLLQFLTASSAQSAEMLWGVLGGPAAYGFTPVQGITISEAPLGLKILLGASLGRNAELSLEHTRSVGLSGGVTTGIGVTEVVYRYYPFFESPSFADPTAASIPGSVTYSATGISAWLSLGLGFAQGTSTDVSMVGFSYTPALGADWHWGGRSFFRGQFSVTSASGTGSLVGSAFHFGFGRFFK